jgi:hypothetical protein
MPFKLRPHLVIRIALEKSSKQHFYVVDIKVTKIDGLWEIRWVFGIESLELTD